MPGRLSKVFRPITIALPMVSALNRLRSAGMCQGSAPSLPITPFWARATTIVMAGRLSMRTDLPCAAANAKLAHD
jgi:hypothetical protein